ncbi:MAG: metallophosphoesterase family protein [Erysipelotrichaceae bacterium]
MRYVTSDIHGRLDRLVTLYQRLALQEGDMLYILGDLIDRGPDSLAVLLFCMEHTNMIVIRGNHEAMLLEACADVDHIRYAWLEPGFGRAFSQLPKMEQKQIINWVTDLPYFILWDDFLLVHAGIDAHRLEKQLRSDSLSTALLEQKQELLWIRDDFITQPTKLDVKVVFGHTPRPYIDLLFAQASKKPYTAFFDPVFHDKIGIDTGNAGMDGRLCCLCLETLACIYIS